MGIKQRELNQFRFRIFASRERERKRSRGREIYIIHI